MSASTSPSSRPRASGAARLAEQAWETRIASLPGIPAALPVLRDALWLFWHGDWKSRVLIRHDYRDNGYLPVPGGTTDPEKMTEQVRTRLTETVADARAQAHARGDRDVTSEWILTLAAAHLVVHGIDLDAADHVQYAAQAANTPVDLLLAALRAGLDATEIAAAITSGSWPDPQTLATMTALRSSTRPSGSHR